MKRIVLLTACSLITSSVFAAVQGPYIGLGAGYGVLRTPSGNIFDPNDPTINDNSNHRGGWAGRAYAGYNVNNFIGAEAGWAYYPRSIYKASDINGNNSSIQYNAKAVDGVIKLYFPFLPTRLSIYGILGAAYVTETIQYNNGGIATDSTYMPPPDGKSNVYKTRPMYGIGASYDLPCHWTISAQYTQIQRLWNFQYNSIAIPFINLATINLSYRFMQ